MPRKRKAKTPITDSDNSASTAIIDRPSSTAVDAQAAETQHVEQPPVEQLRDEQPPTFVERVAATHKRSLVPDPFLVALDNEAGVRLFENRQARVMAIKFDERPGQPVLDRVKEQGYRWNPESRVWTRSIRDDSAMSTRIDAERLYHEVRDMIRQDKKIDAGQDIPF
jgi:hypothetical protein